LIGSGGSLAVAIGLMGALGLLSAAGLGTSVLAALPTPTPPSAVVLGTGPGAVLRDQPGGGIVGFVNDGDQVVVLGGPELSGARLWWHVRTVDSIEGWLVASFLNTVTPGP
jgi:hypothetical protein